MELADIDLLDRDRFRQDIPHDWFSHLRAHAPVYKHPEPDGPGFWVVTKHADVIACNRDASAFSSDQERGRRRVPLRHGLQPGGGPRFCLGAQLARLEIRLLFEAMAERYPRLEALGSPDRLRSNFIGGIKHLPVALHGA